MSRCRDHRQKGQWLRDEEPSGRTSLPQWPQRNPESFFVNRLLSIQYFHGVSGASPFILSSYPQGDLRGYTGILIRGQCRIACRMERVATYLKRRVSLTTDCDRKGLCMSPKPKKLLFLLLTFVCLMTVCLVPARTHYESAPPPQGPAAFLHRRGDRPHEGPKNPFTVPPWTLPEEGADGSVPPAPQFPEPYMPHEEDGPIGRHAAVPHSPHIGEERPIPPPHTRASYRAASVVWGMVIGILFAAAAVFLGSRIIPRKKEKHLPEHTKE